MSPASRIHAAIKVSLVAASLRGPIAVSPAAGQSPAASTAVESAGPCPSPASPVPLGSPSASMVVEPSMPAPAPAESGPPAAGASMPPANDAAAVVEVSIKDFSFQPATIEVPVCGTVTWTNDDSTGHTVTADDASFDSGTLATGANFSHTFETAGTFAYHCSIHPTMTATITVQ